MKGEESEDGTQKVEEDGRHQGGEKRRKEEFFFSDAPAVFVFLTCVNALCSQWS